MWSAEEIARLLLHLEEIARQQKAANLINLGYTTTAREVMGLGG